MNKFGIVTKCEKDFAFVRITRDSMCGDNCGSCNLCGNKNIEIKAINSKGAKPGDRVEMNMPEQSGFSASLLAYGMPMLILIAGIIVGAVLGYAELFGVISLGVIALWYIFLMVLEKNKKYAQRLTPEIVKIVKEG